MSVRKKEKKRSLRKPALSFLLCAAFLSGCLSGNGTEPETAASEGLAERLTERAKKSLEEKRQPQIMETDWSEYFQGINGAAVLYDAEENRYLVYNPELAETRRSPCSTFKIISSLLALENGVIDPENSVRKWSGEYFTEPAGMRGLRIVRTKKDKNQVKEGKKQRKNQKDTDGESQKQNIGRKAFCRPDGWNIWQDPDDRPDQQRAQER